MIGREPARLLLADGTAFDGWAYGARGSTAGEAVFNTAMTGYQEILTDPSYRAQIVTMTYPHIGNYGVNAADAESDRIQVAGFVVRDPSDIASNWRSEGGLEAYLADAGVVGICGVDTRALVRRIRTVGAMPAAIMSGSVDGNALEARLAAEPSMEGRDLVSEVTCDAPYAWTEGSHELDAVPQQDARFHVVAYDFGIKRNILRLLVDHGCRVTVVPARTSAADALALEPDGIFLSNGPGDPAAVGYAIETTRELIGQRPLFGICLGHQIIALALGGSTFKLRFGHRGGNQPVQVLADKRVETTSQNHGFAVDGDSLSSAQVSHVNLNDQTVAGLSCPDKRLFSVQYHPEASPGPHDARPVFAQFVAAMEAR